MYKDLESVENNIHWTKYRILKIISWDWQIESQENFNTRMLIMSWPWTLFESGFLISWRMSFLEKWQLANEFLQTRIYRWKWYVISWNNKIFYHKYVELKKTSDFIANDSWLWNTHGANEMTSLNDIFFKYLCCKSQLHAIGKIKILKRQLTNPTLLRVAPNCIIESQGGWKVKFLHLQKTKHWNTVQKVNKTRVSYGKNWLI